MNSITFFRSIFWAVPIGLTPGIAEAIHPGFLPQLAAAPPVAVSIASSGATTDIMLQYRSVFTQYRRFTEQQPTSWHTTNNAIKKIDIHARDVGQMGSDAPASTSVHHGQGMP